jgi:hypothetical protein
MAKSLITLVGDHCECKYCLEGQWLKKVKPKGSRRMQIILFRHHRKLKNALAGAL